MQHTQGQGDLGDAKEGKQNARATRPAAGPSTQHLTEQTPARPRTSRTLNRNGSVPLRPPPPVAATACQTGTKMVATHEQV